MKLVFGITEVHRTSRMRTMIPLQIAFPIWVTTRKVPKELSNYKLLFDYLQPTGSHTLS